MIKTLTNALQLGRRGVISIIGAGGKTSLMFRLAKELEDAGRTVLTTTTTKIFMPPQKKSLHTVIAKSVDALSRESSALLPHCSHFSAGSDFDPTTGKMTGFETNFIDRFWENTLFDWMIVEADGARCKPLKSTGSHEPVVPGATTHLVLVTGLDAVGKLLNEENVHRAALFSKNTGIAIGHSIDEKAIARSTVIELEKARNLGWPQFHFVVLNKGDTAARVKSGQKIATFLETHKTINQIIIATLNAKTAVKMCVQTSKPTP